MKKINLIINGALTIIVSIFCFNIFVTAENRKEVYVGVADNHMDQIANPTKWSYVSENADGFYINFIELDSMYKQDTLNAYGKIFTNKNALIESDMNSSLEKEKGYINMLQTAGFTVPYTSINYGWSNVRRDNLKNYALKPGQDPRLCFVQQGPWVIGGTILGSNGPAKPYSNADYRSWTTQSDGMSTDGPMGFWLTNKDKMKAGSYSMVKYAHSLGKKALVMIAPYGGLEKSYNPSMYLALGITCVKEHEDSDAEPDIWSVFEYATSIAAIPEKKTNGAPINSTTGMAYYLIKHIKGDPGTLDLYTTEDSGSITGQGTFEPSVAATNQKVTFDPCAAEGTVFHYTLNTANSSTWCDYTSILKATTTGSNNVWTLQFKLAGLDITESVMSGGFKFYKSNRLIPLKTTAVDLYITRTTTGGDSTFTLNLELTPHNGSETADSMQFMAQILSNNESPAASEATHTSNPNTTSNADTTSNPNTTSNPDSTAITGEIIKDKSNVLVPVLISLGIIGIGGGAGFLIVKNKKFIMNLFKK